MTRPSNQKGLAPIVVVIVLAALVALGAVGWFVFANEEDESMSSNEPTTEETEEATEVGTFSGSYVDAIERGQAMQCTWTAANEAGGEQQASEGQFYTDGENRGYTVATVVADGTETTAYSVFDSEYIYSWAEIPGVGLTGTKIPMTAAEPNSEEFSQTEQQQSIDVNANYSFDCEPWTVDEALLTPPDDVTFTEINTQTP